MKEIEAELVESTAIAIRERSSVMLMPVMDLNTAKARLLEFQEFCAHYLQESKDGGSDGGDYGVIPGTKKSTLLKSGADKLAEIYGLYDEYVVMSSVEDWERGLFDYTLKCVLKSRRDDSMVGSGVGSCSSFESKYRWRDAKRLCPKCGKATIIKGQEQYGGGWICWFKDGKSDGCKAKFADNDRSITDQVQGRVENPDIIDAKNTILKMAKKRAKIDAVIGVTRSSGIFTQDMDDIPMPAAKPPVEQERTEAPRTFTKPNSAGGNSASAATTQEGAAKPADQRAGSPEKARVETDSPVPSSPSVGTTPAPARLPALPPVEDLAKQAEASMTAKEAMLPADHIETGQAVNFAKLFKDGLKPALRKNADDIRYAWLKKQGIVDGNGEPTSKAILKANFYQVREAALDYAKSLESWG